MSGMERTLRKIVSKIAETPPDFPVDVNLHDELAVDSVRSLEILFEVEKAFGVVVPEARYAEARTFMGLLNLVASLRS